MAVALLSVGLMGLLVFLLGLNVSRIRGSVMHNKAEEEARPESALRKAVRAHGNCIEYVPTLSLLILALGLRMPLPPVWVPVLMFGAVAARYVHAAGVLTGATIYSASPLRFIGALGTYITGAAMSVALIVHAIGLF